MSKENALDNFFFIYTKIADLLPPLLFKFIHKIMRLINLPYSYFLFHCLRWAGLSMKHTVRELKINQLPIFCCTYYTGMVGTRKLPKKIYANFRYFRERFWENFLFLENFRQILVSARKKIFAKTKTSCLSLNFCFQQIFCFLW